MFTRTRRRAILVAAIMIAGSPALRADEPNPTIQIMPPLPLLAVTGNGIKDYAVRNNPFCETQDFGQIAYPIQLASGDQVSAIRLKPIGTAVGLQPIGGNAPVKVESPALKIEESAARIHINPLLGSQHHVNPDLVEAEVISPHDQFAADVPATSSSKVLTMIPPVAPAPSERASSNQAPSGWAPPQAVPVTAAVDIAEPAVIVKQFAEQPADATDDQQESESEPIFFSMSDDSESSLPSPSEPAAEPIVSEETFPVAEAPIAETAPLVQSAPMNNVEVATDEVARPAAELDKEPVRRYPVAVSAPALKLDLEPAVTAAKPEPVVIDPPVLAVPATDANQIPDAIYRSEPIVSAPVIESQMETKAKRYRPPVAVVAPPLAIERQASENSASIVRPTVKSVEAPTFENDIEQWESIKVQAGGSANKPMPKVNFADKSNESTPLYLSRAQVRSLTVGGQLRRVSVADKSVCQAFAAGPNQLKLIGTGNGVTRLVVWADATDDAPTRVRSFEIHVDDAVDASGGIIGNKTKMLNQSIREAFPTCAVSVHQEQGGLVVIGDCDSEESAKKIVRMIRKTCLIPVRDELKIR